MSKLIRIHDLENKDLHKLPIRRGCSGGPCACLGTCEIVEGYVDRAEFEQFMYHFKSIDEFLSEKCETKLGKSE